MDSRIILGNGASYRGNLNDGEIVDVVFRCGSRGLNIQQQVRWAAGKAICSLKHDPSAIGDSACGAGGDLVEVVAAVYSPLHGDLQRVGRLSGNEAHPRRNLIDSAALQQA